MLTSDKPYPETATELLNECEALTSSIDLYTLGEPSEYIDWKDGCPEAADYRFGVSYVPAQWVARALGEQRGAACPRCKRPTLRSWDWCPYCGQLIADGERPSHG